MGSKENALLSVIIPVYNVQDYLDECLQSVVSQTYPNLEIILIDDGSTDHSGEMCDGWQRKDSRVRVIHMGNGGQAKARNTGMANAWGDYVGFVDSDDVIEPDMYERLLKLCIDHNMALSCARFDTFGENGWNDSPETGKAEILSAHDMLEMIIWPWVTEERFASSSVWDRLYRRDLIQGLRFPDGKLYEDIPFSTEAIVRAGECAYINQSLYHYRVRKTSTTGMDGQFNDRWLTDKYPMEKEQIRILENAGYKDLVTMVKYRACMDLYRMKYQCSDEEKRGQISKAIREMNLSFIEPLVRLPGIKVKVKTAIKTLWMKQYMGQRMRNQL